MIFDNARYLSLLIKRVYMALLFVIVALLGFAGFFAKKWYDASKLENVYVVFPDKTFAGTRADESLVRSEYEIIAFARMVLEKALAHNEYSLEENLKEVSELMDKESVNNLLSKVNEEIESLYKDGNAVSKVVLEEIEVNKETHPHEVLLYYNTYLHFVDPRSSAYEEREAPGGLYFQVEILERSYKNPYGLQIRKLKFLSPKTDK
ncbi:MAG: hypothetical protein ACYC2U_04860 [Candidatus Amoebophilus sp.]